MYFAALLFLLLAPEAEARVFFCSPLVREHLLQVPGKQRPEDDVKDERDPGN